MIDRADAVNLARTVLKNPTQPITGRGVMYLANAVMRMDEYIRSHEAVEKGDPQNPVENAVDAARYRWLRDTGWPELSKLMLGMPMDVDAEIDAAMSSQSAPEDTRD